MKKNEIDIDFEIMDAFDYFSNEYQYGDHTMAETAEMIVEHLADKDIKTTKTKVLRVLNNQR
jgi:hypothetical protein